MEIERVGRDHLDALEGELFSLFNGAGEAEVEDPHSLVSDDNVVGLEVPMDEPGIVGSRQARSGLGEHFEDRRTVALLGSQPRSQRDPAGVFHRDVQPPVVFPDLVDPYDVRMGELPQDLCLSHESGPTSVSATDQVRMQELQRNIAIQVDISGGVDHPHAPRAQPALDREAADPDEPALRKHLLAQRRFHQRSVDLRGVGRLEINHRPWDPRASYRGAAAGPTGDQFFFLGIS